MLSSNSLWRARLSGALLPPILAAILVVASAAYWPNWPMVGDLGRMFDSLIFHIAGLAVALIAVLMGLGNRRLGGALLLALCVGSALNLLTYVSRSEAVVPEAPVDLTVLWFNVLSSNSLPPERLAAALETSGADIAIVAEAAPLASMLDRLAETFPYQAGCLRRRCELLFLSKRPLQSLAMRHTGGIRDERMVSATLLLPGGQPLTVQAVHLVKPWFFGFTERDEWYFSDQVSATTGPLIVVGDFNAAPWSRRVRTLANDCDLAPVWPTPASWPSNLGRFGIPIDQALVRGGAVIQDIVPWGEALGSNHRGLLIAVAPPLTAEPHPQAMVQTALATPPCTSIAEAPLRRTE